MTLLATKLYIPPLRLDLIPRPRLVEQLDTHRDQKLILISAPAGFGKTTLVSAWIHSWSRETSAQQVAWLSLDAGDDDPIRFWRYVVAALQTVDDSIGGVAQSALQSPQPPSLESLVTALINDLVATPAHITLVLDDYHRISAQPIHASLNFLLDHAPATFHLVITTRADPPLFLSRRRARSEILEIRSADLRFTSREAAQFMSDVRGLDLPAEDMTILTRRTEGWIVGLQMAALSLRDRADKHGFVAAFAGDDRYIGDYLLEEVLNRQPPHVQSFLLQTSILERMCGPLCDAVLGRDVNAQISSSAPAQEILEHLERANLFVLPLDDRRHWYRYHHLFADLLRTRLHQSLGGQDIAQLYLRASAWYEREGDIAEAVSCALASDDSEYAAALIERHAPAMILRSETALALDWLTTLPEDMIRSNPFLCLSRAWSELYAPSRSMEDSAQVADQWVQAAEMAWAARSRDTDTIDRAVRDRFIGRVAVLRARLSWRRRDPVQEIIDLAQQALDCIPQDDLALRSIVLYVLGTTVGDLENVTQTLDEARKAGEAGGNLHFAILAAFVQAAFICYTGRFRQAAEICQEVLRTIVEPSEREKRPLPIAGGVYIVLGNILLEWGDLEGAERALSKGMALIKLVGNIGPIARWWGHGGLSRLRWYQGDVAGARGAIEEMEHLESEDDLLAAVFRARLDLLQAERSPHCLAAVDRWVEERQPKLEAGMHDDERAVLARFLIARYRISTDGQPDLQPLFRYLDRQSRIINDVGWGRLTRGWGLLDILILKTMALHAQGEIDQALVVLHRALELSEPEGFVLAFVEEGAPMARLLYQIVGRGIMPEYVGRLLAAFEITGKHEIEKEQRCPEPLRTHAPALIEALTRREIEILQLVAAGLSNREIADKLVISLGTVKVHTRNIYGKLQVRRRTEAVARARNLGLLP